MPHMLSPHTEGQKRESRYAQSTLVGKSLGPPDQMREVGPFREEMASPSAALMPVSSVLGQWGK